MRPQMSDKKFEALMEFLSIVAFLLFVLVMYRHAGVMG